MNQQYEIATILTETLTAEQVHAIITAIMSKSTDGQCPICGNDGTLATKRHYSDCFVALLEESDV